MSAGESAEQRLEHIERQMERWYEDGLTGFEVVAELLTVERCRAPVAAVDAWLDAEYMIRWAFEDKYGAYQSLVLLDERPATPDRDQQDVANWRRMFVEDLSEQRRDALRPYAAGSL